MNQQAEHIAPTPQLPTVCLEGIDVHLITEAQCIAHVVAELRCGRGGVLATLNLDYLRRIRNSAEFRKVCEAATVRVADGMPLVWASRILGRPLPERVTGSDLVDSLTAAAAQSGYSVFLLGGNPGSAEGASQELVGRYPSLHVAGLHCPPMGFERDEGGVALVKDVIAEAHPDIVYVALGSPKQDYLIRDLRREFPGLWWVGVGISFSFVAGEIQRAPSLFRKLGFEWLHRLVQEPRRLGRRYLIDGLPYAASFLGRAVLARALDRRAVK